MTMPCARISEQTSGPTVAEGGRAAKAAGRDPPSLHELSESLSAIVFLAAGARLLVQRLAASPELAQLEQVLDGLYGEATRAAHVTRELRATAHSLSDTSAEPTTAPP